MDKKTKDYHSYVFRDGKLVAEFENMYINSEGVPWHQDEQDDWIDVRLTKEMLSDVSGFNEIHDLSCGLGYYLALMGVNLGTQGYKCYGYDISETAIKKAKNAHPNFNFFVFDLMGQKEANTIQSSIEIRKLFIVRGTLWYVFSGLDTVLKNIKSMMFENDLLLIVQNFPPLDKPFIGKEVLPNYHALVKKFSSNFSLVRHLWYEDTIKVENDNWFIGLFKVN